MRTRLMKCLRFGWQARCKSTAPEKWNPRHQGMSAAIFKSVFQTIGPQHPSAMLQHPKFRRRWDWHLRNFIYALLPPAAAYVYVKAIEWGLSGQVEEYREKVEGRKEAVIRKEQIIEERTLTLEERLDHVEQILKELEQEKIGVRKKAVVDAAKSILAKSAAHDEKDSEK